MTCVIVCLFTVLVQKSAPGVHSAMSSELFFPDCVLLVLIVKNTRGSISCLVLRVFYVLLGY